jgi:hypothetical protein
MIVYLPIGLNELFQGIWPIVEGFNSQSAKQIKKTFKNYAHKTRKDTQMKAIVIEKYGPPETVLQLKEVEKPTPKDNEVLVKIFAASINWADNAAVRGKPFLIRTSMGLLKPKNRILGTDIAGRVEAVGRDVKQFKGIYTRVVLELSPSMHLSQKTH